jgi:anti-sigma factor RsiW
MHRPIKERLEDFLRGTCDRELLREFEAHLEACEPCFQEVQEMRAQALAVRALRGSESMAPAPGFYARVMARIEAQPKPTVWSQLLDPLFGRRLVYATATLLVLFGTYLVSTENAEPLFASSGPEVMLAAPATMDATPIHPASDDPQRQRDATLVNLATYQE